MKKTIAVLLCLGMLGLSLAGCGVQEEPDIEEAAQAEASVPSLQEGSSSQAVEEDLPEEPEEEEPEEEPLKYEWEYDTPENQGMDGDLLQTMHTALDSTKILSAVTVRNGVIVDEYYNSTIEDEYYGETANENSVFRLNSCSKSFTSTLIGIAIGEGLIEGVDVLISEYFPQVIGTDKEAITIRHLLEHTSGIQWDEFTNSARSFWALNESENWVDYVLDRPMDAAPGTTFTYTTGGTHLLAAILEQVVEGTMWDYAQEHLFKPLGMDSVHWREDPQGILDGGNGIEMTARDAAKFGQLFLTGGIWDGQQLVPADWVQEATSIQVERYGTSNGSYGYQWWIMSMGGYDTFYALGAMGQFIVIVPELDLVVVMISSMTSDTNTPYSYIANYVLAACQ